MRRKHVRRRCVMFTKGEEHSPHEKKTKRAPRAEGKEARSTITPKEKRSTMPPKKGAEMSRRFAQFEWLQRNKQIAWN